MSDLATPCLRDPTELESDLRRVVANSRTTRAAPTAQKTMTGAAPSPAATSAPINRAAPPNANPLAESSATHGLTAITANT